MIGTGGMRVRRKIQGDTPMTTITAAKPFDAAKYKETTREQWQAAASAWNDWGPLLRAWLGPATEIMLDMANVGPGTACSTWLPARATRRSQAAERVGPGGHVLATDISSNILAFARGERAPGADIATSTPRCWTARTSTCPRARSTRSSRASA